MILRRALLALAILATYSGLAFADEKQDRINAAFEAANKAAISGPSDIPLKDEAKLKLPGDYVFIPKAEGNKLMKAFGNSESDKLVGIIMPKSDSENWAMTVDFVGEGYVKDEEAKKWNADELLKSLGEGTEASNEERVKMGFEAIKVDGWIEPPSYDAASHKLVWSMRLKRKIVTDARPASVNYNTYALGRDGYFELNLITNEKEIERQKPAAKSILAALQYNDGKRYEDFNASTDHIAEYGIAALIGGIAAKKLGLLALAGVFIAKFAKLIAIGVAVAGGGLWRLLTGRKKPNA